MCVEFSVARRGGQGGKENPIYLQDEVLESNWTIINPEEPKEKVMDSKWLSTETDEDVTAFLKNFWNSHSDSLSDDLFWVDEIRKEKNNPDNRLQIAFSNLPLPAAFREAAIALRAMIRKERKERKESSKKRVKKAKLLYWLAAINSLSIKYSSQCGTPGYNIIESIPGEIIKSMKINYKKLGYEKLDLLNKTDIKWLKEILGEPDAHSTLNELQSDVWCEYEQKFNQRRGREFLRLKDFT